MNSKLFKTHAGKEKGKGESWKLLEGNTDEYPYDIRVRGKWLLNLTTIRFENSDF